MTKLTHKAAYGMVQFQSSSITENWISVGLVVFDDSDIIFSVSPRACMLALGIQEKGVHAQNAVIGITIGAKCYLRPIKEGINYQDKFAAAKQLAIPAEHCKFKLASVKSRFECRTAAELQSSILREAFSDAIECNSVEDLFTVLEGWLQD